MSLARRETRHGRRGHAGDPASLHGHHRREAIPPALAALQRIVDQAFPIELVDVEAAASLLLSSPHLSARDVLHVAIMRRYEVDRILSFDRGFDLVPGLTRLG